MKSNKPFLLIPVENQVRELDAKILLAYIAARRGLSSIIGAKREVESLVASFPRSIYIAKSLLHGHSKFLKIAQKLGHVSVAWDEDALVHLPPEIYYSRRLSAVSMNCVSHLFAWGEDNAELWRQYPELPKGMPIHVTGNPRNDLLRPEIQPYFQEEASKLRDAHGDFILINTNFNHVNAFAPNRTLFQAVDKGEEPRFGKAARGMPADYAEGLNHHKRSIFEHFQKIIPDLEKSFPTNTIVVRPHQVESHDVYLEIASRCKRVRVTNKGYVVPWLMACKAIIHNGCTTGVEAYAMGVPAISYRAARNDYYDYGFYRLPNTLSHQCYDFVELKGTLDKILAGDLGPADGEEQQALMNHHLAGQTGALACERIVDVLENVVGGLPQAPKPPVSDRMEGWFTATKRRFRRRSKARRANSNKSAEHHQRKYPAISADEMRTRIAQFQRVLGDDSQPDVIQIHPKVFEINA